MPVNETEWNHSQKILEESSCPRHSVQISQLPVLLTFLRLPKLLSFHILRLAEKKKGKKMMTECYRFYITFHIRCVCVCVFDWYLPKYSF